TARSTTERARRPPRDLPASTARSSTRDLPGEHGTIEHTRPSWRAPHNRAHETSWRAPRGRRPNLPGEHSAIANAPSGEHRSTFLASTARLPGDHRENRRGSFW